MVLDISDWNARELFLFGILPEWEDALTRFLIKTLRPEDVFYDIGANWGFYTLLAEKLGAEAHSFEPAPSLWPYLSHNTKRAKSIMANHRALSRSVGKMLFYDGFEIGRSGVGTTKCEVAQGNNLNVATAVEIESTTLDSYVGGHRIPTVLKIDVEGAELDVLEGGLELLRSHSPVIAIETWGGQVGERHSKPTVERLLQLGYLGHTIDLDGDIHLASADPLSVNRGEAEVQNLIFLKK